MMNEQFQLTESDKERLHQFDDVLDKYCGKPGALIPALQTAQNMLGYIPKAAMEIISNKLGEPMSRVLGVTTFYSFFSMVPRGKYLVRVCLGTACYVRGGKDVLEELKKVLKIDIGQTTADRMFSLEVGRCFGACGLAPVIIVNEDVHKRVKPTKVGEILTQYRNMEKGEMSNEKLQ
jgi:NADH:ubiquinone oxidoreductase subunit E